MSLRSHDLRPLNAPAPLRMQSDARGRIVAVWRQGRLTPRTIASIQDHWRIDDECGANTRSPASTTTCCSTTARCSLSTTTCYAMNGSNSVAEAWNQTYTPGVASRVITAEQFIELPDDGHDYELVHGRLVEVAPSGFSSAQIGLLIGAALVAFVRPRRLGELTNAEGGYILARAPDTVRAPDVAFIRAERVPEGADRDFFVRYPPELAVEVMSHTDRLRDLRANASSTSTPACAWSGSSNPNTSA